MTIYRVRIEVKKNSCWQSDHVAYCGPERHDARIAYHGHNPADDESRRTVFEIIEDMDGHPADDEVETRYATSIN